MMVLLLFHALAIVLARNQSQISNIIESTSSNNVTLENADDNMWLVNINIGIPAQSFKVQIDTGSNILWVPQEDCSNCMQEEFNTALSQDYRTTGQNVYVQYGTGQVYGQIGYDQVSLIGSNFACSFEMMFATQVQDVPNSQYFSGIMGISNNQQIDNIFQTSVLQGTLKSSLYGLALQPLPFPSFLLYGQIDQKILSNLVWVPSISNERWMLNVEDIYFNNQQQQLGQMNQGLLDSGTSCLILDEDLYNNLVNNYLVYVCTYEENTLYCPCRPNAAQIKFIPNITIGFKGIKITVSLQNYLFDYYSQSALQPGRLCQLCISSISTSQANFMIFGDPLFMSMVAIFDKQKNQIGIIAQETNVSVSGGMVSLILSIILIVLI